MTLLNLLLCINLLLIFTSIPVSSPLQTTVHLQV